MNPIEEKLERLEEWIYGGSLGRAIGRGSLASANRYYRNVNGRMVLSAAAKNYRYDVQVAVIEQLVVWRVMKGPVSVSFRWFRSRKSGDLDNRLKQLLDALRGRVYDDDSQVVEIHAYRDDDKENPRVEITLRAIEL